MTLALITILGCIFYHFYLRSMANLNGSSDATLLFFLTFAAVAFIALTYCCLITMGSFGLLPILFSTIFAIPATATAAA